MLNLRNRFLLTVSCCPIYHWLKVSHEVDKPRAPSGGEIFIDDWPTTSDILGNKSLVSKTLFQFYHTRNDEKASVSFRCFQFSAFIWKISPKTLTCNRDICMYFVSFRCEKTTLHRLTLWKWKLTSPNKSKWRHARPCSDCCRIMHGSFPLPL